MFMKSLHRSFSGWTPYSTVINIKLIYSTIPSSLLLDRHSALLPKAHANPLPSTKCGRCYLGNLNAQNIKQKINSVSTNRLFSRLGGIFDSSVYSHNGGTLMYSFLPSPSFKGSHAEPTKSTKWKVKCCVQRRPRGCVVDQ